MKTPLITVALSTLLATLCAAQWDPRFPARDAEADQTSTTVVHKDETYTTTERDNASRKLVRQTMRKNGTVIMRSVFTLDEYGRELRGEVQDGLGKVLFRSVFGYDKTGVLLEERVYDASNRPVRRLVYQPDRLGGRKAFCHNYSGGAPAGAMVPLANPANLSTTSTHAFSPGSAPGVATSSDGSSIRVSGGAVRYPGTGGSGAGAAAGGSRQASPSSSSSTGEKRRRLRIFRRNR